MYKTDYIVHFPKEYICKSNVTCGYTIQFFVNKMKRKRKTRSYIRTVQQNDFIIPLFIYLEEQMVLQSIDKEPVHTNQFCHEFLIYTMYIRIRREETKHLLFFVSSG